MSGERMSGYIIPPPPPTGYYPYLRGREERTRPEFSEYSEYSEFSEDSEVFRFPF